MDRPCTVLHDEVVAGARVVFIDVTEGADNVLDLLETGIGVLLSVHRHPERDDGLKTYLCEECSPEDLDFDWQGLSRELGFLDEACLTFADLRPTEALWSRVEPERVWAAVKKSQGTVATPS